MDVGRISLDQAIEERVRSKCRTRKVRAPLSRAAWGVTVLTFEVKLLPRFFALQTSAKAWSLEHDRFRGRNIIIRFLWDIYLLQAHIFDDAKGRYFRHSSGNETLNVVSMKNKAKSIPPNVTCGDTQCLITLRSTGTFLVSSWRLMVGLSSSDSCNVCGGYVKVCFARFGQGHRFQDILLCEATLLESQHLPFSTAIFLYPDASLKS